MWQWHLKNWYCVLCVWSNALLELIRNNTELAKFSIFTVEFDAVVKQMWYDCMISINFLATVNLESSLTLTITILCYILILIWMIFFSYIGSVILVWSMFGYRVALCSFKIMVTVGVGSELCTTILFTETHLYCHSPDMNTVCCEVLGWCQCPLTGEGNFAQFRVVAFFLYSTEADCCRLLIHYMPLSQCFTPSFMSCVCVCVCVMIACFRDSFLDVDEPFCDVGFDCLLLHFLSLLWRHHLVRRGFYKVHVCLSFCTGAFFHTERKCFAVVLIFSI